MAQTRFYGEFRHILDPKFRMFLPATMRDKLAGDIVLTRGIDCCVAVYPMEAWEVYTAKLDRLEEINARKIVRYIYSSATETQLDAQGRVFVPESLRTYACLEKNIVVVGAGNHVEIWNESKWNDESDRMREEDIAETLLQLGF